MKYTENIRRLFMTLQLDVIRSDTQGEPWIPINIKCALIVEPVCEFSRPVYWLVERCHPRSSPAVLSKSTFEWLSNVPSLRLPPAEDLVSASLRGHLAWHSDLPGWHGHASSPFVHARIPCLDFFVEAKLLKAVCDDGAAFGTDFVKTIANVNERLLQLAKTDQTLIDGSKSVSKAILLDIGCCDLFLETSRLRGNFDRYFVFADLSFDRIDGSRYRTTGIDVVDLGIEVLKSDLHDHSHSSGLDEVGTKVVEILSSEAGWVCQNLAGIDINTQTYSCAEPGRRISFATILTINSRVALRIC